MGYVSNWIKIFFGWSENVFLLFVYMRPFSSTREDINTEGNCYERLEEQLARVSDRGNVIVAGDMNARIGEREECFVKLNEMEKEKER